jgi:hypothetical protein
MMLQPQIEDMDTWEQLNNDIMGAMMEMMGDYDPFMATIDEIQIWF